MDLNLPLSKASGRAHGGLDMERSHVLLVLVQQGDVEVHSKMHVLDQVLLRHGHVTDDN